MRYTATVALALLTAACGGNSPTSPTPTPPSTHTWRLTGTVSDTDGGAVLAGASVAVLDGPNVGRSTTTSAGGTFELTGLQESGFSIRVRKDGYDDAQDGITLTADTARTIALSRTRLNLAGAWSGTYTLTLAGQRGFTRTSWQLVQDGTHITGTYTNTNNSNGVLDATLSSPYPGATLSGALRLETESGDPTIRCVATGAVIATPSATALAFAASALTFQNCSGDVRDVVIEVTRATTTSTIAPAAVLPMRPTHIASPGAGARPRF
jgi:hypothetical protein